MSLGLKDNECKKLAKIASSTHTTQDSHVQINIQKLVDKIVSLEEADFAEKQQRQLQGTHKEEFHDLVTSHGYAYAHSDGSKGDCTPHKQDHNASSNVLVNVPDESTVTTSDTRSSTSGKESHDSDSENMEHDKKSATDHATNSDENAPAHRDEHDDIRPQLCRSQEILHKLRAGVMGETLCVQGGDIPEYLCAKEQSLQKMWFADVLDALMGNTSIVSVDVGGLRLDSEVRDRVSYVCVCVCTCVHWAP
jgi:hypothetical protein